MDILDELTVANTHTHDAKHIRNPPVRMGIRLGILGIQTCGPSGNNYLIRDIYVNIKNKLKWDSYSILSHNREQQTHLCGRLQKREELEMEVKAVMRRMD